MTIELNLTRREMTGRDVRDGKMQDSFPEIAAFRTGGLPWWSRNWEVVVREEDD